MGELTTNDSVSSGVVPSATVPDGSGMIDANKPQSSNTAFEDTENHFSDKGDSADVPSAMPSTPDIADWDGVSKESDGSAEAVLPKDLEGVKDSELEKGNFHLDPVAPVDNFFSETELNKEAEIGTGNFHLDPVAPVDNFTQTDSFESSNSFTQDNEFTQDTPMVVTE